MSWKIEQLVEDAVISDFGKVPLLAQYPIRNHDYAGVKAGDDGFLEQEAQVVITVSATDQGDFKVGSGIRKIGVNVEIRVNEAADSFAGTLMGQLCEQVNARLQPSGNVGLSALGQGRETAFSTAQLQVFGILANGTTARTEQGLERIRVVPRTFIAAQIA
jgi:hypothetical protein